jgi:hypothetical protein
VDAGVPFVVDSSNMTWLKQLSVVRQIVQHGEVDEA